MIESLKQWIEKTLQKPGDELLTPYILPTATTGAASAIIEGMTLHTAVGLDFSNRHNSLSDKKQEIERDQFKNIKFLILLGDPAQLKPVKGRFSFDNRQIKIVNY